MKYFLRNSYNTSSKWPFIHINVKQYFNTSLHNMRLPEISCTNFRRKRHRSHDRILQRSQIHFQIPQNT
ncbi:hypothetical protein KFK09_008455 [Dendrobium nobile]|uniref:Uncharacterized protein n=1 Tax=Dendrobium nobile TaxID=94219 RepID=A0A8T3BMU1_DENNO|nr:hypothetical protein KFK09_008455 [Dendrobium nobile]